MRSSRLPARRSRGGGCEHRTPAHAAPLPAPPAAHGAGTGRAPPTGRRQPPSHPLPLPLPSFCCPPAAWTSRCWCRRGAGAGSAALPASRCPTKKLLAQLECRLMMASRQSRERLAHSPPGATRRCVPSALPQTDCGSLPVQACGCRPARSAHCMPAATSPALECPFAGRPLVHGIDTRTLHARHRGRRGGGLVPVVCAPTAGATTLARGPAPAA